MVLNPNRYRKTPWEELAEATRVLRYQTYFDVHRSGFPGYFFDMPVVEVFACICWTNANRAHTDEINLPHLLTKPMFDGMQDAKLVRDDSQFRLMRVEQYVLTKAQRSHYPHGCVIIGVTPGHERETITPIDRDGFVTQAWLDGIPRE